MPDRVPRLFVDIEGAGKVRIAIGNQISDAVSGKAAHAAVRAAFYADIVPEIIISQNDTQYGKGAGVRKALFIVIACGANKLHLPCGRQPLIRKCLSSTGKILSGIPGSKRRLFRRKRKSKFADGRQIFQNQRFLIDNIEQEARPAADAASKLFERVPQAVKLLVKVLQNLFQRIIFANIVHAVQFRVNVSQVSAGTLHRRAVTCGRKA